MFSASCARHADRGYTLIELVVVLVILGVLAGIAGPRFFGTRTFSERGYADEVASAIRYAQKVAVASNCSVRVSISATGYNAMQQPSSGNRCNASSSSWTTAVRRPDGDAVAGTPPSDANVSSGATLVIDSKGAIVSGATNLTIGPNVIDMDAATGFVVVR